MRTMPRVAVAALMSLIAATLLVAVPSPSRAAGLVYVSVEYFAVENAGGFSQRENETQSAGSAPGFTQGPTTTVLTARLEATEALTESQWQGVYIYVPIFNENGHQVGNHTVRASYATVDLSIDSDGTEATFTYTHPSAETFGNGIRTYRAIVRSDIPSEVLSHKTPLEVSVHTAAADAGEGQVTISGAVEVGSTLTAMLGDGWDGLTSFSYAWYRGATFVGGGPTYVPTQDDIGQSLHVVVEGWGGEGPDVEGQAFTTPVNGTVTTYTGDTAAYATATAPVTFSAEVVHPGGGTVNSGTVTFARGAWSVEAPVINGVATVDALLPVGWNAAGETVTVTYGGAPGLPASGTTATITIPVVPSISAVLTCYGPPSSTFTGYVGNDCEVAHSGVLPDGFSLEYAWGHTPIGELDAVSIVAPADDPVLTVPGEAQGRQLVATVRVLYKGTLVSEITTNRPAIGPGLELTLDSPDFVTPADIAGSVTATAMLTSPGGLIPATGSVNFLFSKGPFSVTISAAIDEFGVATPNLLTLPSMILEGNWNVVATYEPLFPGSAPALSASGILGVYDSASVTSSITVDGYAASGGVAAGVPAVPATTSIPASLAIDYVWRIDRGSGPEIVSTEASYTPVAEDIGRELELITTGTGPGVSVSHSTQATIKAAPHLTITAPAVNKPGAVPIDVTLADADDQPISGTSLVTVWVVNEAGTTVMSAAAHNTDGAGHASVTTPSLPDGVYTAWATVAADGQHSALRVSTTFEVLSEIIQGTVVIRDDNGDAAAEAASGLTYTADAGQWTPAGVDLEYEWWVSDGSTPELVGTGATFTPSLAHVGRTVSVRVTGSYPDYASAWAVSAELPVTIGTSTALNLPSTAVEAGPVPISATVQTLGGSVVMAGDVTFVVTRVGQVTPTKVITASGGPGGVFSAVPTLPVGDYIVTATYAHEDGILGTSIATGTLEVVAGIEGDTPQITRGGAVVTEGAAGVPHGVDEGTWSPGGVTFGYEWFIDDGTDVISVGTDPTYTPSAADVGKQLYVTVTGSLSPFAPVSIDSDPVTVLAGSVTSLDAPAVAQVGDVDFSATVTDVDGNPLTSGTVQFTVTASGGGIPHTASASVDGSGVATATINLSAGTYTVVTVFSGIVDTYAGSSATAATEVAAGIVAPTPVIQRDGADATQALAGHGHTVATGPWSPGDTSLTIEWQVDGSVVHTGASYTPLAGDAGKKLRVSVTGTRVPFSPVTVFSTELDIVIPTVTTLDAATPTTAGANTVSATVTDGDNPVSSGTVEFTFHPASGPDIVESGTVDASGYVAVSTTLPAGTYSVTARYLGTSIYAASEDDATVVAYSSLTGPASLTLPATWTVGEDGPVSAPDTSGEWLPDLGEGTELSYAWYVTHGASSPVLVGDEDSYEPSASDVGGVLTLTITGTFGTLTTSASSNGVALVAATTTQIVPAEGVWRMPRSGTREITVTVSSAVTAVEQGTITLYDDDNSGAVIGTATLDATSGGVATFTVTAPASGSLWNLRAVYVDADGAFISSEDSGAMELVGTLPLGDAGLDSGPYSPVLRNTVLKFVSDGWPGGTTFTFRWLRNGSPIPGADDPTYRTVIDDAGTTVTLSVTAHLPGYDDVELEPMSVLVSATGVLGDDGLPLADTGASTAGGLAALAMLLLVAGTAIVTIRAATTSRSPRT